jgi:magnesium-transporting ATPase (P-type)
MAEESDYVNQTEFAIAIDNDFLSLIPQPQITSKIKLFSRISPENKVKIVRLYK